MYWGQEQLEFVQLVELGLWIDYRIDVFGKFCRWGIGGIVTIYQDVQCRFKTENSWKKRLPLCALVELMVKERPMAFLDALDAGRVKEASDPRDHVYAFLGIPLAQTEDGHLMIEPDYTKDVDNVYIDTASALLQNPREAPLLLGLTLHSSPEEVAGLHFPSWVPRWNRIHSEQTLAIPTFWYCAGGSEKEFQATVEGKKLFTHGFMFDQLSWTSTVLVGSTFFEDARRSSGKPYIDHLWESTLAASNRPAFDLEDEFTLTLCRGYPCAKTNQPIDMQAHRSLFANYRGHVRRAAITTTSPTTLGSEPSETSIKILSEVRYCNGRKLAHTTGGRLALVPRFAEPGDVCCILPGSPVPFILRRGITGDYNLVGDSYVHGTMKGELMKQFKEGKFEDELIVLI
jgi:hypothetical protein